MKIQINTDIKYNYTSNYTEAEECLKNIPDIFAVDFETDIRYTEDQIKHSQECITNTDLSSKEKIKHTAILNADPLKSHPYHCTITHCSIAWDINKAFVFIFDNKKIAETVLNFLVNTNKTQIWHNYCYDGRFIEYFTGKQPKNIEDTQILSKTLLNNVNNQKSLTGLKHLAGRWYGQWAISADYFNKEDKYNEKILKYAAIDSCATYKLWLHLNDYIKKQNKCFS